MARLLLRLPFELRLQVWEFVLGPTIVEPCRCSSKPGTCKCNHPGGCCEEFDMYKHFDNRLLRVCRQIYGEVHFLLVNSPKQYVVCNGLCLESLFLGIKIKDRRWIKRVRVDLYIGTVSDDTLNIQDGRELLRKAEGSCGAFVQSALKCQGVGLVEDVAIVGDKSEDNAGRRLLCVDVTLK